MLGLVRGNSALILNTEIDSVGHLDVDARREASDDTVVLEGASEPTGVSWSDGEPSVDVECVATKQTYPGADKDIGDRGLTKGHPAPNPHARGRPENPALHRV